MTPRILIERPGKTTLTIDPIKEKKQIEEWIKTHEITKWPTERSLCSKAKTYGAKPTTGWLCSKAKIINPQPNRTWML